MHVENIQNICICLTETKENEVSTRSPSEKQFCYYCYYLYVIIIAFLSWFGTFLFRYCQKNQNNLESVLCRFQWLWLQKYCCSLIIRNQKQLRDRISHKSCGIRMAPVQYYNSIDIEARAERASLNKPYNLIETGTVHDSSVRHRNLISLWIFNCIYHG